MSGKALRDKVVVVTGAASGIGRATANAFARERAKLVLCDKNEEGLNAVEREVAPHVDHVEWRVVDVSSATTCEPSPTTCTRASPRSTSS